MAPLVDPDDWGDYSRTPAPENAQTLLSAVSGAVRGYCGWSISREVVVDESLDSWGTRLLNLPTLKLESIQEVKVDDVVLVDGTDFEWSAIGAVRRSGGNYWPYGYRSVIGSWTHGYALVPEEIQMLCVSIVKRTEFAPAGILQKSVGGITLQFGDRNSVVSLTDAEKSILDPYLLELGRDR